jgi:Flp pilus assembly pilin Flp
MLSSLQILKLYSQGLLRDEAQDLVEYALLIALLGFAVTVGLHSPAVSLNNALTTIANAISGTIS